MSESQDNLDFYRALRAFNFQEPAAKGALGYARIFNDLALRIHSAECAQQGEYQPFSSSLLLPAFHAYIEREERDIAEGFERLAANLLPGGRVERLAGLAQWLGDGFSLEDPFGSSYQVWVGAPGSREVRLYGPQRGASLPPGVRLLDELPIAGELEHFQHMPAALLSHYDVHGLAAMAIAVRTLRGLGFEELHCAMSYEWTGEIGKLWKRAVPRTISDPRGNGLVLLLDCSVHSRDPQRTLRAVAQLDSHPQSRLLLIDHHHDTFQLAPQMMHERLSIVLTDVLSCSLITRLDEVQRRIAVLGALGDKVPEVASAFPRSTNEELYSAVDEYNNRCLQYSPTPPELKKDGLYPLAPLWEALAAGQEITPVLAAQQLGASAPEAPTFEPQYSVAGGVIFVTQRLETRGREWYSMLEGLMAGEGLSYAVALRMLSGRRANMLLLTRWTDTHMPPVRFFIPPHYLPQCLGHPGALWADLDPQQAISFLREVAAGINSFLGRDGNMAPVLDSLKRNIIDFEQSLPSGDSF